MKKAGIALIALTCATAHAVETEAQKLAKQWTEAGQEATYQMYKDDTSPLGKAIQSQYKQRKKEQFEKIPEVKTLKECIKENSVIDDDVRACMRGLENAQ